MGTREPDEKRPVVNPEWVDADPRTGEPLSPATPVHVGPPPKLGPLNDTAAGNDAWKRTIIFHKRPVSSTEVKSLRRQLRIVREEIARLKFESWFDRVMSIAYPVPRLIARLHKCTEPIFQVQLLP